MRKRWIPVLVALVAGCGGAEETAKTEVVTPFDAEFRAASDEFGVPFELLRGMGSAQTGHHRIDPARSESGQAGVMGLQPAAIAEAARLLGVAEERIASDDFANIRGAAALVADRRLRGETWNGAALAAAAIEEPSLRARWLKKYARHLTSVGELVPEAPAIVGSAATAGDYPGATWVPANTGNYANGSRGLDDVSYVVIHDIEGSYEGAISWFQNPASNVSSHYVIADEGDITQMVWEADIAWHCGSFNSQSVGLEHEGYASDPDSYPETMYVSSAALTRYLTDKYSIPRTRDYVIGHVEVPGATHTDPGPYWQWDHYMDLIDGTAVNAKLVGFIRDGDIYDGPGIEGATVTLDNGRSTTTDVDGYYEIDELDPGLYVVTATADGYDEGTAEREIETAGGTWWRSVALSVSTTGDDDDDVNPKGHSARGAGACSVTASPSSSAMFPFGALAFVAMGVAVALRRRR